MNYEARLWLRRALGALVPLGLLVTAGLLIQSPDRMEPAFALSGEQTGATSGPPDATPSPPATGAVADPPTSPATGTPTPTPTATSSTTPTPEATPEADRGPGIDLTVMPNSTGALEVSESVRLGAAVRSVTLSAPEVGEAGTMYAGLAPRATQVQLMVDGRPFALVSTEVTLPVRIELISPARTFELRYVLEGATVRSMPSSTGRASIVLAPLFRDSDETDPVTIQAPSSAVRNVTCPLLPAPSSSCAQGSSGSLRVEGRVDAQTALFVLQTDLPKP